MFRTKERDLIMAKIVDVDRWGNLVIEDVDGNLLSFGFKEIQFIY